jgi:hypothetical protein
MGEEVFWFGKIMFGGMNKITMEEGTNPDWKLKLRYGKIKTSYKHFTVLGAGVAGELVEGFSCPKGNAWMGMKVWATSTEEAGDMIQAIGSDIGFEVTGDIEVYETEPVQPPQENPFGYDINFTPFEK